VAQRLKDNRPCTAVRTAAESFAAAIVQRIFGGTEYKDEVFQHFVYPSACRRRLVSMFRRMAREYIRRAAARYC
jgi:hypothetical protein